MLLIAVDICFRGSDLKHFCRKSEKIFFWTVYKEIPKQSLSTFRTSNAIKKVLQKVN